MNDGWTEAEPDALPTRAKPPRSQVVAPEPNNETAEACWPTYAGFCADPALSLVELLGAVIFRGNRQERGCVVGGESGIFGLQFVNHLGAPLAIPH